MVWGDEAKKMQKQIGAFGFIQTSAKLYAETRGAKGNSDLVFKEAIKRGLTDLDYFKKTAFCSPLKKTCIIL